MIWPEKHTESKSNWDIETPDIWLDLLFFWFTFSTLASPPFFAYPLIQPPLAPSDVRCSHRRHSVYPSLLHFIVLQFFYLFTFSHFSTSLFVRLALFGFTAILMSYHRRLICSCTTNHYFMAYWRNWQLGLLDNSYCGLICCLPRSTFRSFSWELPFRRPFSKLSRRFTFTC